MQRPGSTLARPVWNLSLIHIFRETREEDIRQCVAGVLINKYRPAEDSDGVLQYLQTHDSVPAYKTVIRQSARVVPAGKSDLPLIQFSTQCAAARDYRAFVVELSLIHIWNARPL